VRAARPAYDALSTTENQPMRQLLYATLCVMLAGGTACRTRSRPREVPLPATRAEHPAAAAVPRSEQDDSSPFVFPKATRAYGAA
jgi:hypothetical protein